MDTAKVKKGVLFVDDEPNILSSIKRMLRSVRNDFEFYFAESGADALTMMADHPIAIVVSDMRMPGMDGAQLLTEIQQRFPQSIRIMLTGQAEEEAILRTVNIAHQFLSKPCEPEKLKEVLIRSSARHDLVTNEQLKGVVSSIGTLPSIPSIYNKLIQVLKDPESGLNDIAAVIEQDVAMTAKLLQLVNSSFFGLYQKVDSTARAVNILGLDTIKTLTLGVQVFSEIKVQSPELTAEKLWKHSLSVAHCSRQIAMQATEIEEAINNCYLAGMLHDIGRLLLISKLSDRYSAVITSARAKQSTMLMEEEAEFQTTHAEVGAYLLGLWGFHNDIIGAVAYHHNLDGFRVTSFSAALAVHIADYCYYAQYPNEAVGTAPSLNEAFFARNNLTGNMESWVSTAKDALLNCAM